MKERRNLEGTGPERPAPAAATSAAVRSGRLGQSHQRLFSSLIINFFSLHSSLRPQPRPHSALGQRQARNAACESGIGGDSASERQGCPHDKDGPGMACRCTRGVGRGAYAAANELVLQEATETAADHRAGLRASRLRDPALRRFGDSAHIAVTTGDLPRPPAPSLELQDSDRRTVTSNFSSVSVLLLGQTRHKEETSIRALVQTRFGANAIDVLAGACSCPYPVCLVPGSKRWSASVCEGRRGGSS